MTSDDLGSLIYLVLLGAVLVFWMLVQNRNRLGQTVQQAMIWGLIFLGVIAAFGLWGDIRQTVMPVQQVTGDRIELPRARDGHYYLTAEVNGRDLRFVVDTGASEIVLSREDANAIGIDPNTLIFTGRATTANGSVATAPVRLKTLTVGGITDTSVRAWVNNGQMDISLLGMSYLERFDRIEIVGGALILTR